MLINTCQNLLNAIKLWLEHMNVIFSPPLHPVKIRCSELDNARQYSARRNRSAPKYNRNFYE